MTGPSEQPTAPYLDALVGYGFRGPTRFHVPGHKGGPGADPGLRHALGDRALALDIPQDIHGVDIGASPSPFERAEQLAAGAYGARRSWFLTNGATQGNHALCLALAPLGAHVVVQRNAHASVVDGLVLSGGLPSFVAPEYDSERSMAHCVTPQALDAALTADPEARAAFIVSPTYYGMCADVAALAEVCSRHEVALVVDQSWGPHFGFHPDVPESALALGAGAVLTSTHKIVGSLTQSAILHVAPERDGVVTVDDVLLDRVLRPLRSTSPSSLLMASLDAARRQLAVHGEALIHETLARLEPVSAKIASIPSLALVGEDLVGEFGIAACDPLRFVVDTRSLGCTGYEVAAALRGRYDTQVELATQASIVCVLGIGQPVADLERLAGDLDEIARELRRPGTVEAIARGPQGYLVEQAMAPRDAFLGRSERVPLDDAVGRISCESIAGYPPGIPALLPGEQITAGTVAYLRELVGAGARLHGASDPQIETIHVLVQGSQ